MTQPPNMPEYGTPEYEQWYRQNYPVQYAATPPAPQTPRKKHHPVRWTIAGVAGLIIIGGIVGAVSDDNSHKGGQAVHPLAAAVQKTEPSTVVKTQDGTHTAAPTKITKYERYEALSQAAGIDQPGTEAQTKQLAGEVCPMSQTPMQQMLAGVDSDHRDIVGFIVRAYCPDAYPQLRAARTALNRPKPKPTMHAPAPKPVSPETVVRNFYSAINAGDYAKAWALSQDHFGGSYTTFVAGFKGTHHDVLAVTSVSGSSVGVDLKAYQNDGTVNHYTGTYDVSAGRITSSHLQLVQPKPAPAPKPSFTTSEEQAIESAESYLAMGGFSRAGLIDQLDSSAGEGFPEADSVFAVDHVKVDWNEQAVESAKSYMTMGGFSRSGLIDQLTSAYGEQFTLAQATYAADHVGL